jgi:hypothetical protein
VSPRYARKPFEELNRELHSHTVPLDPAVDILLEYPEAFKGVEGKKFEIPFSNRLIIFSVTIARISILVDLSLIENEGEQHVPLSSGQNRQKPAVFRAAVPFFRLPSSRICNATISVL